MEANNTSLSFVKVKEDHSWKVFNRSLTYSEHSILTNMRSSLFKISSCGQSASPGSKAQTLSPTSASHLSAAILSSPSSNPTATDLVGAFHYEVAYCRHAALLSLLVLSSPHVGPGREP